MLQLRCLYCWEIDPEKHFAHHEGMASKVITVMYTDFG